jgi:hypothetical protein
MMTHLRRAYGYLREYCNKNIFLLQVENAEIFCHYFYAAAAAIAILFFCGIILENPRVCFGAPPLAAD